MICKIRATEKYTGFCKEYIQGFAKKKYNKVLWKNTP